MHLILPLYSFSTKGRPIRVTPWFSAVISSKRSHWDVVNVIFA